LRRRVGSAHAALLAGVAGALFLAAPAGAALHVRSVDSTDYPTIRLTVVAPKDSTPSPSLLENAVDMPGSTAHRLQGKSVVLAIDRSQSMRGRPLQRAIAAARTYVRTMPADDRIAVVSFGSNAQQQTTFSSSTIDADGALRGLAVDTREGT